MTSPPGSITSSIFNLQKTNTPSSLSSDVIPPAEPWKHHTFPWRQHHPSSSISSAAFLEYVRFVNLHRFDEVAHLLAGERSAASVWPAAQSDGTASRTDVDANDAVKPAVIARPTPVPGFASAAQRRNFNAVHPTNTLSTSAESSVDVVQPSLWLPSFRFSRTCQSIPMQPCGPSVTHGQRNSAPFLPTQPAVLFPHPPPSPHHRPASLTSSGLSPWLPRHLLSVMHRQLAAAVAAQVTKSSSWGPRQSTVPPPPGLPARRRVDILGPSRLPVSAVAPPATHTKRMFSCPQCRYVTDRKNNLKRHVSTMHHESDKQLECCSVQFKSKASLRDHVLIFHGAGYQCRHCGRNFCRKALLKRHLTVHSGQKDYVCARCDYATSHKSNLERHKKVHERQSSDDVDQFSDDDDQLYDDFPRRRARAHSDDGNDVIESAPRCDNVTSFSHIRSLEPDVELTDCSSCSSVDTAQERHSVSTPRADSIRQLDTDDDDEEIINVVDDLVT